MMIQDNSFDDNNLNDGQPGSGKIISIRQQQIRAYTFEEYTDMVEAFHGYAAPGLLIGGLMVDIALRRLPRDIFFNACCETSRCLPDAIQMLTPCTMGNGWLSVIDYGKFALSCYEKFSGEGVRVYLDESKLDDWDEIGAWFFKRKPKKEQDSAKLARQIQDAWHDIYGLQEITIYSAKRVRPSQGDIVVCPVCGDAYPAFHGRICRLCQGNAYYQVADGVDTSMPSGYHEPPEKRLVKVPVEESVGKNALHDMTQIIPGKSKGPAIKHGQTITPGDVCRLQQMGRKYLYVDDSQPEEAGWVHEDAAAAAFARAMAGDGVVCSETPREGKVDLIADRDGLINVDWHRLELFNNVPDVICATRKSHSMVSAGRKVGGTRAIPLYLAETHFNRALDILRDGPLLQVHPLRQARVGILITGSEIVSGLIQDRFEPIIAPKITRRGCELVASKIVPDEREEICQGVNDLLAAGADLIVTTAGLSVDPDDVTRQGLVDAGAEDLMYGMPILPGAMTLLAHIGGVQLIGVPACALYFKTTSFDLLLPWLLAGIPITRQNLARLGHGALCWECKTCTYPKCAFGKA